MSSHLYGQIYRINHNWLSSCNKTIIWLACLPLAKKKCSPSYSINTWFPFSILYKFSHFPPRKMHCMYPAAVTHPKNQISWLLSGYTDNHFSDPKTTVFWFVGDKMCPTIFLPGSAFHVLLQIQFLKFKIPTFLQEKNHWLHVSCRLHLCQHQVILTSPCTKDSEWRSLGKTSQSSEHNFTTKERECG